MQNFCIQLFQAMQNFCMALKIIVAFGHKSVDFWNFLKPDPEKTFSILPWHTQNRNTLKKTGLNFIARFKVLIL